MKTHENLISALREAQEYLARPDNDFSWSGWNDDAEALHEIDRFISHIESGILPSRSDLDVLFAPTGPIQEVSVSSGWGHPFLSLAERFDEAMAEAYQAKNHTP